MMKCSKVASLVLAFFLMLGVGPLGQVASAAEYSIDATHSAAVFKIKHLGISYVHGRFTNLSGTIHFDKDGDDNSVEVSIKTKSIDTGDSSRDEHVRGDDFLYVTKFPVMSFVSQKFTKVDDEQYTVTGDFTLHGVTKKITADVEFIGITDDREGGTRVGFETQFSIKRSEYDMGSMFPMIGDKVQITLSVEAGQGEE